MSVTDTRILNLNPKADQNFTVCGKNYRITVLTDCLLRMEYSADGVFEDRATRLAANRNFDRPEFKKYYENDLLIIETGHLKLIYDEKPFSKTGLRINVDITNDWSYGLECDNLGGTVRTLDGISGATKLEDGLLSSCFSFSSGFKVIDDSETIVINESGWPEPIGGERTDIYFFGYMQSYEECIRDFYRLSGDSPILPRYALGNWWSRYHDYSDAEYRELIETFKQNKIPLSVVILDMNWHLTSLPDQKKYGSLWTGYTFDRELFPDYKGTMKYVHEQGLKLSLNLHPKDGIRAFEDCYEAMCEALGLDATKEKPIEFDASDKRFMEAYFKTVLNPYEDDGVDLWWIDWQQEGHTAIDGFDSLWMLNYCHYIDSARNGKVPLTLSRYAGIGSHRFPLGFSGDTYTNWESLAFQPEFTATAANVGYSWWSHDICGHGTGYEDEELYIRWLEFGVFAPILRLHSTFSDFNSKEPWKRRSEIMNIAGDYMRLRHRLVPYIFTMMYRNHEQGIPMVRPLYHKYPGLAIKRRNIYFFGDSLIVSPITAKADPSAKLAYATTCLPAGIYIDVFTAKIYKGQKTFRAYRPLDKIPVFAKAGAIIPFAGDVSKNGVENPEKLELHIYGGADGEFTMVEDNNRTGQDRQVLRTEYKLSYGKESKLSFTAPAAIETVPEKRSYTAVFTAFCEPEIVTVTVDGAPVAVDYSFDKRRNEITVSAFDVKENQTAEITVVTSGELPKNEILESAFEILRNAQIEFHEKQQLYTVIKSNRTTCEKIAEIMFYDGNIWLDNGPYDGNRDIALALTELLSASE